MAIPFPDEPKLKSKTSEEGLKVVVFTCNWNAYSGLEAAGTKHLTYSTAIHPLKVMCLGQISSGIILKTLEKGADGVLLLGCPHGECHFEFGNRRAEELFTEVKELIALLGYKDEQCKLDWIPAGDGEAFVNKVQTFIEGLNGSQAK
jgi:coenzyme F420-reducing hydrogenase delta subunit